MKSVYAILSKHNRAQICIYWNTTIMLTMRKGKEIQQQQKWLCDEIMVDFLFHSAVFPFCFSIMTTVFPSGKPTLPGFVCFPYVCEFNFHYSLTFQVRTLGTVELKFQPGMLVLETNLLTMSSCPFKEINWLSFKNMNPSCGSQS